jgi:hypothetical protein
MIQFPLKVDGRQIIDADGELVLIVVPLNQTLPHGGVHFAKWVADSLNRTRENECKGEEG